MIEKYLDRVVQQLDEKVGRLQEAVGAGSAKDFSEYQKMCGEIQGLLSARRPKRLRPCFPSVLTLRLPGPFHDLQPFACHELPAYRVGIHLNTPSWSLQGR